MNDYNAINRKFIKINNVNISYFDNGNGIPVFCCHGNPGISEDFINNKLEGYRFIAIDRPGHGCSERYEEKSDHLEHQVHIIHELFNALELKKVIFVGHSWGCLLALKYALTYPSELKGMMLLAPIAYQKRKVVSSSSLLLKLFHLPRIGEKFTKLISALIGKAAIKDSLRKGFLPDAITDYYKNIAIPLFSRTTNFLAIMEDKYDFEYKVKHVSTEYKKISIKTVVICGDKDIVSSCEEHAIPLCRELLNSWLIKIPNKGHQLPQVRDDIVMKYIKNV